MHVVICDDDKKDIERLRRLLEEYGAEHDITFQINEYDSGKVLISSIEGGARPDIIFLDINMDEMDGLTLAKRLREKLDGVPLAANTLVLELLPHHCKGKGHRNDLCHKRPA